MANLVIIFGPPASGKAAVGHVLAQRLGYRFFHNHLTADPVAALFGWGSPKFGPMVDRLREALFSEAAADPSIPGIVFTFVWDLDLAADGEFLATVSRLFEGHGGQVYFVELLASLETRVQREGTPFRLALKPSQRDVAAARARQIEFSRQHRMNTQGPLPLAYPHLVVDTEAMSAEDAAGTIMAGFGLAPSEAGSSA